MGETTCQTHDSANRIQLSFSPSSWLSNLARDTVVLQHVSTSGHSYVIGRVSTSIGDLLNWKPIGVGHLELLSHLERPHHQWCPYYYFGLLFIWQSSAKTSVLAHAVFQKFTCRNVFNMPEFKYYHGWKSFYSKRHVSSQKWTNGMLNFKQHVENTAC